MPAEPTTGDVPLNWTSSTEQTAAALVVRLSGELDYPGAPQLEALLAAALDTKPAVLVLDLAEVAFCDSSSLQVLLRIADRALEQGTGFALARARRAVTRPIQVLGLSEQLPAFESVDDAVAAR
jgi:anti-sigma B factor antagonist